MDKAQSCSNNSCITFGTVVMELVAKVPFAQAPGMGLNALFTFTVVLGLGFTWNKALAMFYMRNYKHNYNYY
jgi:xanthine/uracil/vitamin C permease (AzgA family)